MAARNRRREGEDAEPDGLLPGARDSGGRRALHRRSAGGRRARASSAGALPGPVVARDVRPGARATAQPERERPEGAAEPRRGADRSAGATTDTGGAGGALASRGRGDGDRARAAPSDPRGGAAGRRADALPRRGGAG